MANPVIIIPGLADVNVAWIAPTLLNSWVDFGGAEAPVGYHKDSVGYVHLRGMPKGGSSASAVIFTLPSGFRPEHNSYLASQSNEASCGVLVDSLGNVSANFGGSTVWVSLAGVVFLAE